MCRIDVDHAALPMAVGNADGVPKEVELRQAPPRDEEPCADEIELASVDGIRGHEDVEGKCARFDGNEYDQE